MRFIGTFCTWAVGCRKFDQYIRMLCPGRFILVESVHHSIWTEADHWLNNYMFHWRTRKLSIRIKGNYLNDFFLLRPRVYILSFYIIRLLHKPHFIIRNFTILSASLFTPSFLLAFWLVHSRKYWPGLASCKVARIWEHFNRHTDRVNIKNPKYYIILN